MNIIMSRAIQQQQQYPHRIPPSLTPTSPRDFTDAIPIKEVELAHETLGFGSFGTVFKGRWRGQLVAVKQFKTREQIDSFRVEVKQLSCVKHQNIIKLYSATIQPNTAYLIMEYAEGGSLNHLLHEDKQQQYDLRHACNWALQTAKGVAYLHGITPKPIMHRDLKPANLLLFQRGKILKIGDFGTASTVHTQMTNNTGSASYMAPEVFATSSYLESGDVFSWSIIFWEILARRPPYSQEYSNPYQILWRVKQEGTRPSELEDCPKIIWNLITRSWNKDPKKRPTMAEIATEMEFIYKLTGKSTFGSDTSSIASIHRKKSPYRHHHIPITSHFMDQNQALHFKSQLSHQQQLHLHHHQQQVQSFSASNDGQQSTNGFMVTTDPERDIKVPVCKLHLELVRRRAKELEELAGTNSEGVTGSQLLEEIEVLRELTNDKRRRFRSKQPDIFSEN